MTEAELLRQIVQRQADALRDRGSGQATVGDYATEKVRQQLDPRCQTERIQQLIAEQQRAVADHRLWRGPCARLAWAVEEGRVSRKVFDAALADFTRARIAGRINGPRSKYWNGVIKKLLGIDATPKEGTP